MEIQLTRSQQKSLFLIGITTIYIIRLVWLEFLDAPYWWDEEHFWETSLTFSDKLFPSLADISDYEELNTPLPFVTFGLLEHLFGQGIRAGRLLNFLLSLGIAFLIGWPTKEKGGRAILCLIGLFLCPYYLILSGRLYTEMIACFWVLMGMVGYVHNRHWLSCIAFVLAISTRQYMLAFPLAIAAYEFMGSVAHRRQAESIDWKAQGRWIAPLVAACSILVWFYLFGGLAPKSALVVRADLVPSVQRTLWGMAPGSMIHLLSYVGLYIVIPEFLLFNPINTIKNIGIKWRQHKVKVGLIALGLLVFIVIFPPQEIATGYVAEQINKLPYTVIRLGAYYFLSLLTCIRFSRFSLTAVLVFFNALIMVKAHPWDRYALPMVVVFWYLKSLDLIDQPAPTGLFEHKHDSLEPSVPTS